MKRGVLKRGTKQLKRSGFKRVTKRSKINQDARKPKKAPKPRTKTKSLSKLKKELDRVFSIYIREKYPARCYTCGVSKHRKNLQCGHFVSRQYLATRWDENNCRPQCVGCNMFGNGKPLDFEENLKRELGSEFVEEMKARRHQILKLDRQWYEEKIAYYTSLIA